MVLAGRVTKKAPNLAEHARRVAAVSKQAIEAKRAANEAGVDKQIEDGLDAEVGKETKKYLAQDLYSWRREEIKSLGLEPRGVRSKAKAAKHAEKQKRKRAEQAEKMEREKHGVVESGPQDMNTGGGVAVTGGGEESEGLDEGEVGGMEHPEPMSPGVWAGAGKDDDDDDDGMQWIDVQ